MGQAYWLRTRMSLTLFPEHGLSRAFEPGTSVLVRPRPFEATGPDGRAMLRAGWQRRPQSFSIWPVATEQHRGDP